MAAPRAQHPENRPTTLHSGLVDLTVGIEYIIPNPHSARYAGQTLQEGGEWRQPRRIGMAELPRGTTREVRRGGSGVLELLLIDFDKEGSDGYIRVERPTSPPTTAQLVVRGGKPSMALHESVGLVMGQAALEALRIDAAADDSRLSVHIDVDLELISELHPEARLHLDEEDIVTGQRASGWIVDPSQESSWWQQKQRTEWAKSQSTMVEEPEEAPMDESAVLVHDPGNELEPGYAYLIDDVKPDSSLAVAVHLAAIGHPLLVLSRTPPQRLAQEHGLPESVCRWLSERTDTEFATVNPGLESVRKEIDDFLLSATRAVIVLDGLEYLSGLHGFDRLIGMLRDLLDSVQSSDDVVLMSADLAAWVERERSLLLRECDLIPAGRMSEWAERPAVVEGHPFCQDFEEISVPAPKPIDVDTDAKEAFKAASGRLMTIEEEVERGQTPEPRLEPAIEEFSVEAIIDEMRREDSEKSLEDDVVADVGTEVPAQEVQVTEVPAGGEVPLPDWATAPSANMGDEVALSGETASVDEPVDEPPHAAEEEVQDEFEPLSQSDQSADVQDEVSTGPRAPTVNHRGESEQRISVPTPLTSREMASAALRNAAADSREITSQLEIPGYEAWGLAFSSMNEAGERARKVGDWVTDEQRDWEALQLAEMQSAVERAKGVRHLIPAEKGATPARLNIRSWSAAAGAAAETRRRAKAPEEPDNPLARVAATRAQKVRTLTQYVVGSEMAALYSDRRQVLNEAGIELEVLGRVTQLAEKGHNIQPLIERLEADSSEGKTLLKKMEKDSERVTELLNRLNGFEENGVVDPVVCERYRKRLLSFEDMDEIASLLTDLEG